MGRKGAPFNCTYESCTASFSRPDRLKIHLRTHTGERPFVCEYENCDKSYVSSPALKRHEATHEGTYRCTVEGCFEILKTKQSLQKHIDGVHHKKVSKLYKCTECDKDFNKHNWLQRHMYRHTGIFPHKCPREDCGKGFLMPSRLKRHMKTHDGHLCKIPGCEKVFYKWSEYVTHLKEYHPAVHKCEICKREFSTSSNLKTHYGIHKVTPRKVFACEMPDCARFYFEEKNLKFHMRSYHDVRTHVCQRETCHKAFKTKEELDHHTLRHIRKQPRKKKKPRPSFSSILSGCADPRRFIYKKPRKRIILESSDEFSTDDEVSYRDTSSDKKTPENSHSEVNDSDEQVSPKKAGPSHSGDSHFNKILPCKPSEPDSTDMDSSYEESSPKYTGAFTGIYKNRHTTSSSQYSKILSRKLVEPDSSDIDSTSEKPPSKITGAVTRVNKDHSNSSKEAEQHSEDSQFCKATPCKRIEPDSTDMDSSYEGPSPNDTDAFPKDHPATLPKSEQLHQQSVPNKGMELDITGSTLDGTDLPCTSMSSAIGDGNTESVQSHTSSKSTDKDAHFSEYVVITAALFGNTGGKSCYSGSDDVSSFVSEPEDILSCDDVCSGRE